MTIPLQCKISNHHIPLLLYAELMGTSEIISAVNELYSDIFLQINFQESNLSLSILRQLRQYAVRSDSLSKRILNVITRHWQLMTGHTSKNHVLKVHNHDDDNNSCITLKDDKKYTCKVCTLDYWVHVGPLPEKLREHVRQFLPGLHGVTVTL